MAQLKTAGDSRGDAAVRPPQDDSQGIPAEESHQGSPQGGDAPGGSPSGAPQEDPAGGPLREIPPGGSTEGFRRGIPQGEAGGMPG